MGSDVMAQKTTTDGGTERGTKRFSEDLSLADVQVGDRIDPQLVPRSPHIEVGEPVAKHLASRPDEDDDRTFSIRLIVSGYRDSYQNVQAALVYDPEADLFARLTGHTSGGAMSQKERDWKVRDVGREMVVVDQWDVEIPDLGDESEAEYVAEWVEIMADGWRHGDDYEDLERYDDKAFRLRDYDGRTAKVQYELEN